MYAQPAFRMEDHEEMVAFIDERRFATLVVNGRGGPIAAHLPMIRGGDARTLEGHVANGNPILAAIEDGAPALAIFNGPDAYVTPALYPSKREHGRVVPTWNYIAVEARGALSTFADPVLLRSHLEALTDVMEADAAAARWAVSDAPEDYVSRLMGAITGLRMAVDDLEGLRKLSQNRAEPDRASVQLGFSHSANPAARALAAEMFRKT